MPLVRQGSNDSTHSSLYPATGPSLAVSNGVSGEPSPRDMHADVTCSDAEPMHNLPWSAAFIPAESQALPCNLQCTQTNLICLAPLCTAGVGLDALPLKASDRKKFSQVIMRRWVRVDRTGQGSIMQVGFVNMVRCLPQPMCGGSSIGAQCTGLLLWRPGLCMLCQPAGMQMLNGETVA